MKLIRIPVWRGRFSNHSRTTVCSEIEIVESGSLLYDRFTTARMKNEKGLVLSLRSVVDLESVEQECERE